jgi:hypothetical protein
MFLRIALDEILRLVQIFSANIAEVNFDFRLSPLAQKQRGGFADSAGARDKYFLVIVEFFRENCRSPLAREENF